MSHLVCSDTAFPRRRKEMEARINSFKSECSLASARLTSLVKKAESCLGKLERNSANYKDCYLHLMMRKLDEYIFLVEEFNSGLEKECLENDYDDFAAGSRSSTRSKASMHDNPVMTKSEYSVPRIANTCRPLFNIDETSSQSGFTQQSERKKKNQLVLNTALQEPSNYIPQRVAVREPVRQVILCSDKIRIKKDPTKFAKSSMRPPLFESSDDKEHEDALVQGCTPRDVAENSRFYNGGPPRSTCVKNRSTENHFYLNLAVTGGRKVPQAPVMADMMDQIELPPPTTLAKVKVTHVAAPNVLFVQFVQDHTPPLHERKFGSNIARNLRELVILMNTPAPGPRCPPVRLVIGELLAAPYNDKNYYRAKVINYDPGRLSLEVFFIDYGNHFNVPVSDVFELEPGWEVLPAQAVECILGGIKPKMDVPKIRAAIEELYSLTVDKIFKAIVVESNTSANKMTIDLYNEDGDRIMDKLVELDLVDVLDA